MRIFFKIDENNRLTYYGNVRSNDEEIELNVADGHEVLSNPFVFKYENGTLIKDTEYQQFIISEREKAEAAPSPLEELQAAQTDLVFTLMINGVI